MIAANELRSLLRYNLDTGEFVWIVSPRPHIWAGSRAGTINSGGYRIIGVKRRLYYAHRLAWLYVYGQWPSGMIDHANSIRDDNRIANLREATVTLNSANSERRNSTGFKGVFRCGNRYSARIQKSGVITDLGKFASAELAGAAYCAAAERIFGEFARTTVKQPLGIG